MKLQAPAEPDTTFATLPSGLTVAVVHQPHLHSASAQLFLRVGSRYESEENAGLSHFLEHMIYRGSAGFPSAFALALAFERLGGGLYAETSRELTSYQVECPPESLLALLGVLADAALRPLFPEVEVEKRIVLEELLEDQGEDGQLVRSDDVVRRLAFPVHPIGLPIVGTATSVSSFTREALEAHHARYYTGANAVLAVAGPLCSAAVQDAASAAFEGLPRGSRATPAPAESYQGPKLLHVDDAESQTTLDLLVQAVPDSHPLNPAQSLLLRILDDGLSTRLHRRVVDELGLAYSISASPEVLEDTVLVDFVGSCAHDSTHPLLEAILSLATELKAIPPDTEELEMARRRMIWDVQASLDSPRAMTEYYGTAVLLRNQRSLSARVAQVLSATQEQVHEAARLVLHAERFAAATVGRLTRAQRTSLARLLGQEG